MIGAQLNMKTLKLLYPEWQGFGIDNRVNKGAFTVHAVLSQGDQFVEIEVPEKEHLFIEGGIFGRSSIAKNSKQALDRLSTEQPDKLFMIGGTCGSELVPVAYLNQCYQRDLAVLWFDAHGDLNTPESSPSGHFHGMVLRTLLGDGDPILSEFVPHPLSPSQVTLVGVRDLDTAEVDYASEKDIAIIAPDDLADSRPVVAAVERHGSSNLYIHLDLDFFNPNDFAGALVPASGGLTMDQFVPILSDLNTRFKVVGLSVVEFASIDPESAARISALLKKSGITYPFR
jgi:arginase